MDDVSLRPIGEADLEPMGRFLADPEAGSHFLWTGFKDPHRVRRRWDEDRWLGADDGGLAIVRGDDEFAGFVRWWDRTVGDMKGLVYEIGISMLPDRRGHGVGTEAQRQLVRYLFDTTPAHRLEAFTDVENMPEQRALEKVGFQREGRYREAVFRAGAWHDSYLYGILRHEA